MRYTYPLHDFQLFNSFTLYEFKTRPRSCPLATQIDLRFKPPRSSFFYVFFASTTNAPSPSIRHRYPRARPVKAVSSHCAASKRCWFLWLSTDSGTSSCIIGKFAPLPAAFPARPSCLWYSPYEFAILHRYKESLPGHPQYYFQAQNQTTCGFLRFASFL